MKVPHDPYGNPGYEDNAHLMDSPASHQRLDLNGTCIGLLLFGLYMYERVVWEDRANMFGVQWNLY